MNADFNLKKEKEPVANIGKKGGTQTYQLPKVVYPPVVIVDPLGNFSDQLGFYV
ncbi:MAG TPA: hypothetical protein VJH04_02665 [archaeon]|nr:hypothetical protein [archaeon]